MSPFGLPIRLWMVGRRHSEPRPNNLHERGPKGRCETWIPVANDLLRHAKIAYYPVEKHGSYLPRTKRSVAVSTRGEAHQLRQSINASKDCVEPARLRKVSHEIHRPTSKALLRNR